LLPQAIHQSRTTLAQSRPHRHYLLSLSGFVKPEDEPEHFAQGVNQQGKGLNRRSAKIQTGIEGLSNRRIELTPVATLVPSMENRSGKRTRVSRPSV